MIRRVKPDPDVIRQQLISRLGWSETERRIRVEAQAMRIDPHSDAAVIQAAATYAATANPLPANPTQEELIP